MVEALRYKLRMFGVPLDGAANVFCDKKAVYKNTAIPESTLRKKHHSIAYHKCREAVVAKKIRVAKQGTLKNLADLFTRVLTADRRRFLLDSSTHLWAGYYSISLWNRLFVWRSTQDSVLTIQLARVQ